jgi:hypothetical protein
VQRPTPIEPMTSPSRSIGTARLLRSPAASAASFSRNSGSSRRSATCTGACSATARARMLPRPAASEAVAHGLRRIGHVPWKATRCTCSPS